LRTEFIAFNLQIHHLCTFKRDDRPHSLPVAGQTFIAYLRPIKSANSSATGTQDPPTKRTPTMGGLLISA
jgi:hypothetical protein